jgi:hypothetical protein
MTPAARCSENARMKTFAMLSLAFLLVACGAQWPDYAGVMGAPAPEAAARQQTAQGLTQSSR